MPEYHLFILYFYVNRINDKEIQFIISVSILKL